MIRDCIKEITKVHGYKVTGDYWSRVGGMYKRYGEETLVEAIEKTEPQTIPLTNMLNIIELKCQHILEHGELDDFTSEILNAQ